MKGPLTKVEQGRGAQGMGAGRHLGPSKRRKPLHTQGKNLEAEVTTDNHCQALPGRERAKESKSYLLLPSLGVAGGTTLWPGRGWPSRPGTKQV